MALEWKGDIAKALLTNAVIDGLTEFGLHHEREAKAGLKAGRGVLTGTYRRSLHAASPTYNFATDDVKPSPNAPERGGSGGGATVIDGKVVVRVGSGLVYAQAVEARYGTIRQGHEKVLPKLQNILRQHAKGAGF